MTPNPLVSIIIRCYNEEAHIGRLLEGIEEQTHRNIEIIVVDSGSTDATVDIAQRYPIKLLHIKPEDFSFGRSLNLGCSRATGEFIVIASAHVYPVYRDWLEKLIAPFAEPNVALAYGKQRGTEESKYSERRLLGKWFPEKSNFNQAHPFCNNANAAIRRELWDVLPYKEELTGLEDTEWATRAMEMDYRVAYVADATVIHNHSESPRRLYNRYRREAIALKTISPLERMRLWDAARLFVGNVLSDYYHAVRDGAFWRNLASIPSFRLMQFLGAYRGFALTGPVTSELKRRFYYPNGTARPVAPDSGLEREKLIDYSERSP